MKALTCCIYILGYSPSSWSSLAGSLWKDKSGRDAGRAMGNTLVADADQRTARKCNVYAGFLHFG